MSVLGDRLRKARERKQFRQIQVTEKTGINNKTLSRYESGGSEPDIETLKILADLYEVSVDWLSGLTDDPSPVITVKENEYDYTKDPSITPELRELLDTLVTLPEEDRQRIIDQALIFAAGIKAKNRSITK